jgi:hypothetical protein
MGRLTTRRGLALGAALIAGGALALPFASQASTPAPATASTGTTATTTTSTTPTTTTTTTAPKPAPKPLPPLAYSGSVEQITDSSALLKARVNAEGLATEYYFQYGPTTAYGSQTPPTAAGSATLEVKLTQTVTGLEPDTIYHFRVLARSSAGTTASADATFTTKKIPLSLTAGVSPSPVVFGSPLGLVGTLSGTGNAGVEVVLQANPYPYTHGFKDLTSPVPTDATGDFSFPIAGLLESTQLRVATLGKPTILSPVITELVAVRVTLHVRPARRRGFVRLYGTVTPSEPGARVAFERSEHGRYVTVSGTTIRAPADGVARFHRTVRLRRRGLYRALVQVTVAAQISGRSRPVLIR